jgi:hypothetical protein
MTIINRDDVPSHLFSIPELDFSKDLVAEPLSGTWFRLGAWTITIRRDDRGVEDVVSRKSLLLPPDGFTAIFDRLESVGNVLSDLGKPGGSSIDDGEHKKYTYAAFHKFELHFTSTVAEPLVFVRHTTSGTELLINPDLWLFLELEERAPSCGIWWDPRRGIEALRRCVIEQDNLEIVEIRVDCLLKYLQARQLSLIVGHYRHLRLFDPSLSTIDMFEEADVTLGSSKQAAKAIVHNRRLGKQILGDGPVLQRRLDLWFQIGAPAIDVEDPWTDQPSFDPYTFTLPTRVGPVAPARWTHFRGSDGRTFEGVVCAFMDRVFFRQEVLTKYEGASGFDVADDGSVRCQRYWGLYRSTARLGNELLSTAIGDFAEGVPFEEWLHWRQYAVEPPSVETAAALTKEETVVAAVNSVVQALRELNEGFAALAASLGVVNPDPLWSGSLDSLAGRHLKWVYLATASGDEFLKRTTLASTLVIDELNVPQLRNLLCKIDSHLHEKNEQTLASRNLLQRVAFVAALIEEFRPNLSAISTLVTQAESDQITDESGLQAELKKLYQNVKNEFCPLAFLYELRMFGGLAHPPNVPKAAEAATKLGLPAKDWHRSDYLSLLNQVAHSVHRISGHLEKAVEVRRSE